MYITDLVTVSDQFNYIMYAYDTTIYFKVDDVRTVKEMMCAVYVSGIDGA